MTSSHISETKCREIFLERVGTGAEALVDRDRKSIVPDTKASIHNIREQRGVDLSELSQLARCGSTEPAILIVENISLRWIAKLSAIHRIHPSFFAEHAFNPPGATPWKAIFGKWSEDHRKPVQRDLCQYEVPAQAKLSNNSMQSWHVDGVVEYQQHRSEWRKQSTLIDSNHLPRTLHYDGDYGWTCSTRISWVRVSSMMYLFLVDAPMLRVSREGIALSSRTSTLRLPLGLNRGGLGIPQLFDQPRFSLHECLYGFFSHPWHLHVMFTANEGQVRSLGPETVLHLVSSSLWTQNLRTLERSIKTISFEDIRRPSTSINDKLHDQRHDLAYLMSSLAMTIKWIPPSIRVELEAIKDDLPAAKYIGYPDSVLQETAQAAVSLDRFLMDTFNLLLSSVGVLEAERSIEQTNRGQLLTKLAFIYVPLSFVTGIFGMNVKEINGSPLSAWVVIVALVATSVSTALVLVSLTWLQAHKNSSLDG